MADVDPVNDVVKHIDELGDYSWNRQLQKKFSDGLCAQKVFILHGVSFSV